MANFKGINVGPSDIRRVSGGFRSGGSARQGWGIETVSMGSTLSVPEARRRLRMLADSLVDQANGILLGAAHLLADTWKEEIDIEGYGPSGQGIGVGGSRTDDEGDIDVGNQRTTGRYYNSIEADVDQDLEIHVGSNIPRPSGRGLETVSYPELLEYGTSQFEGMFIQRRAIDRAGPDMEDETVRVFNILLKRTLMDGKRP